MAMAKASFSDEDLRALQLKSLDLALYFKRFCDENNLMFYLCGGGCIGAVRHHGFIPWDDDLDIFMPRQDYNRLHEIWKYKADTKNYSCIVADENLVTKKPFTLVIDNNTTLIKPEQSDIDMPHGVALDVFPIDGCPTKPFQRKMQMIFAMLYSLYMAQVVPENHGKIVKIAGKIMLSIVPSKKLRYKLWKFSERKMSKYKICDCDYITELCAGPGYMKNMYPKKAFDSAIEMDFEGYKLPIPVGYDDYLKIAFGDYMKLPPKDKQVASHDVLFYDLNNSYKKYKGIYFLKHKEN